MSIKFRLTAMQFLQFFIWGAWLISLGGYMGGTLHFEGGQIGAIFATMGIASLIMPGLMGIIADKWINAERLYGTLHLIGAGALIYASTATTYSNMYWAMLLNMLVYMPTLSLANTVSYNALEQYKLDLIKDFPPIRVWGTVGFICAMWAVDLTGFKTGPAQLYVAAISAIVLGLYAFSLPACPPARSEGKTMLSALDSTHWYFSNRRKWLFSSCSPCCWGSTANYKYLWRPIPKLFCLNSSICRFFRSKTLCHSAIHFSNERNIIHSRHTFLPETFRNQACDAYQYVRLGIPFRIIRFRRSGQRFMDAHPIHDCIWHGF